MRAEKAIIRQKEGRRIRMSLGWKNDRQINKDNIKSLSDRMNNYMYVIDSRKKSRGTARYACVKTVLTIEAAVVLPFIVCFLVFILYFFRILQVQAGVSQALQYTGRQIAAEYNIQSAEAKENGKGEISNKTLATDTVRKKSKTDLAALLRVKLIFEKQLHKLNCPTHYITHGTAGISFLQSDFSENFIELKAVYLMKLPVTLLGKIQYRVVQEVKCRKWTGYDPGQDTNKDDSWLYYTEHGKVYHTTRSCSYLDLSIRGVTYQQAVGSRNKNGGKYYACEKCGNSTSDRSMVYLTDYGERYHSSLTCSGLKRSIYMIRRTKATEKRMCRKCGT